MAQKLSPRAEQNKREYIDRYNRETYTQVNIRLSKELADRVKLSAEMEGMSQRQYIVDAIIERLGK